jgi:hypothetical protein
LRLLTPKIFVQSSVEVGIAVGKRDKLRGFPRQLLHCCNTCGANEDESCRECGDRLCFVLAKLKMNF